ncbi:hypothetical protein GCM10020331_006900 [Ectobacillus funiculus]
MTCSMLLSAFLTGCSGTQTSGDAQNSKGNSNGNSDKSLTVLVEGGSPAFKVAEKTADEFKKINWLRSEN